MPQLVPSVSFAKTSAPRNRNHADTSLFRVAFLHFVKNLADDCGEAWCVASALQAGLAGIIGAGCDVALRSSRVYYVSSRAFFFGLAEGAHVVAKYMQRQLPL